MISEPELYVKSLVQHLCGLGKFTTFSFPSGVKRTISLCMSPCLARSRAAQGISLDSLGFVHQSTELDCVVWTYTEAPGFQGLVVPQLAPPLSPHGPCNPDSDAGQVSNELLFGIASLSKYLALRLNIISPIFFLYCPLSLYLENMSWYLQGGRLAFLLWAFKYAFGFSFLGL